jgi:hypothetical protein
MSMPGRRLGWLRRCLGYRLDGRIAAGAMGDVVAQTAAGLHAAHAAGLVLPTSLSGDLAAALREHGSATLDEHYGHSHQPLADAWAAVSAPCRTAAPLTLRN